ALRALPHVAEARADGAAGELVDALADQRDRKAHLPAAELIAREGVAAREDDGLHRLQLGIDRVRPIDTQVPAHAGPAQHRTGHSVLLRDVGGDAADAHGALEEDLVALED